MSELKLEPCPGCGKSDLDQWPNESLDASGANVIRCAWCHFAAPLKAWNRRTPQPVTPAGGEVKAWMTEDGDLRSDYDLACNHVANAKDFTIPLCVCHPPAADAALANLTGVCGRMLTFEDSAYVPNTMFTQLRDALAAMAAALAGD